MNSPKGRLRNNENFGAIKEAFHEIYQSLPLRLIVRCLQGTQNNIWLVANDKQDSWLH